MRRPLTALAFSQAAGIVLAYYLKIRTMHLCMLCMGACFVFALWRQKVRAWQGEDARKAQLLALFCLCAFLSGSLRMEQQAAKENALLQESEASGTQIVSFEGLVRTVSFRGSRWDLTVDTDSETVLVRLDAERYRSYQPLE
jgi:preprotein translocase subunit YajC